MPGPAAGDGGRGGLAPLPFRCCPHAGPQLVKYQPGRINGPARSGWRRMPGVTLRAGSGRPSVRASRASPGQSGLCGFSVAS